MNSPSGLVAVTVTAPRGARTLSRLGYHSTRMEQLGWNARVPPINMQLHTG